jgi:hypothetical protein
MAKQMLPLAFSFAQSCANSAQVDGKLPIPAFAKSALL